MLVVLLIVELFVDGGKIGLNRFVEGFLGKILVGGFSWVRGVEEDWEGLG